MFTGIWADFWLFTLCSSGNLSFDDCCRVDIIQNFRCFWVFVHLLYCVGFLWGFDSRGQHCVGGV